MRSFFESWFGKNEYVERCECDSCDCDYVEEVDSHEHDDWGLWEQFEEGEILDENEKENVIGWYVNQRRVCKTCNKLELDTQVSYL
jgi:hypothetical protein